MWDYIDRRDLTRISFEELKEAEIDDSVRAVTNIKKKSIVSKVFGVVAFSKAFPHTKVRFRLSRMFLFYYTLVDQD
jgi:hypothetical protein